MLSLDAPLSATCQDFWQLKVSKEFDEPEYYIGQQVLHKMKVLGGEILHPVQVIGLMWTGIDWEYTVELPEDHPMFREEDCVSLAVEHWQLEAM